MPYNLLERKLVHVFSIQTDMEDDNHKSTSSQRAYKIVLAGDAAVGKSSFLMRLCKNEFRGNTFATLGMIPFPVNGKMTLFMVLFYLVIKYTEINLFSPPTLYLHIKEFVSLCL